VARRVAIPDRVLTMGLLDPVDYHDSYVVDAPAGFRAEQSADALAALAFGSVPAWLRGLIAAVHRRVLRLELDLPSTVPVPGWRRLREEPDEVVYGADGRLLAARLVVSVKSSTVRVSTLIRFDRSAARAVWAGVGPAHRIIARVLLTRGVIAASRQDAAPRDT
jgi:Protein of unknown function (DUF2867)